ncbi:hypothetical protein THMIRHAS_19380 [Thiosulfatimonas sediminis]|uniref:Uncharacterized protein n=1 Tax=Thiosulfatimonas sediminis TaxID=2675054 RepID=A0A6F8PWR6_9GAMM|nr:hypothetical protein [Thiosulfatimonas sediminis]BBP46565.1 hypothetical protein THMIRHAS_19380 [Thiosulfatimonas sediminis]
MKTDAKHAFRWYQQPLNKTLFYGFGWAMIAALFIPPSLIPTWQYGYLFGSVPSMLIWDLFAVRNSTSILLGALFNLLILLSPYLLYRKTGEQLWWFYLSISMYALANAGLGITMIISMRNLTN